MRVLKITLLSLLGLVVLIVGGAVAYLATIGPEDVKRLLAEQAEKATGRTLTLMGPLTYELSWTPKIRAEDVRLRNADWSAEPDMLTVGAIELDLNLNRVFDGIVIVESLFLEHAKLTLERDADGRANWEFPIASSEGVAQRSSGGGRGFVFPVIESLTLIDVDLSYDDRLSDVTHRIEIDAIDLDAPDIENPVEALVNMTVNGKRIDVSGTLPPAVFLGDASAPQPFDISGDAMGEPVSIAGKLLFAYEDEVPVNLAIQDLRASVFSSDLSGDLKVDASGRIPKISATLKSDLVDFRPLQAAAAAAGAAGGPQRSTADLRDMLDDRVPSDWLDAAEIALSLNVKELKADRAEISELALTAEMKDGKLAIAPLWAVYADSPIRIEADLIRDGGELKARADLSIKGADFDRLAGTALDVSGLEAGGDLTVSLRTSGGRVGELIAGAEIAGRAIFPSVRYRDPAGVEANRDVTISKLEVMAEARGTNPEAALDLVERIGDIRLDTPLEGLVLKGLIGEAHVRAAEVVTAQDRVDDLDIALSLKDRVLALSIPDMMLAKAHLAATARLERADEQTMISSRVIWKGVDLGVAARRLGVDGTASGSADLEVDLKGEGRTIAAMLGAVDGSFGLAVSDASFLADGAPPSERIEIEALSLTARSMDDPFSGRIKARFEGEAIDVSGRFPSIKALVQKGEAFPFDITGSAAGERVAVKGNLTLVQVGDRFASVSLSGLDARVGRSDLTGSLKLGLEGRRPKVEVALVSTLLDLEPYLDSAADDPADDPANDPADDPANDPARDAAADPASDGDAALDRPFPLELLDRADGSLDLKAGELRLPGLVITDLALRAALQDRVLTVYPSKGVFNDGLAEFRAMADGSKAPVAEFALSGTWTDAQFGRVLKEQFDTDVIAGTGNAFGDLTARGRTPREAMDTVNGHIALYLTDGMVSNTYWELIAADLVSSLLPSIGKKAATEGKLNCFATRFDIKDGLADSTVFLVDSSRVTVGGDGSVNLRDETVDFLLHPKPKDFSFVSLATPIRISGALADPRILPDAAGAAKAAVLGAGAVALTAINPLALMLPLVSTGNSEDPCPAAIALAKGMSAEEAARIGAEANKPPESAEAEEDAEPGQGSKAKDIIKLPGKAVDGIFDGLKKLVE